MIYDIAVGDPVRWTDGGITRQRGPQRFGVSFLGTGSFLPGDPLTNRALLERHPVDTSPEWIASHTGIESRHWAPDGVATSDLAAEAARRALDAADTDPAELDHILLCSTTPDWPSPAAASRVQHLLGATCPSEDKNAACASWIYGIDHGCRLVMTGARRVLVIGADCKSRFVSRSDRRLLPVFADGAGAVVLGPGLDTEGVVELELYTDGSKHLNMVTMAGGSALPPTHETINADLHVTSMQVHGQIIKNHGVEMMTALAEQVCEQAGIALSEVDLFVPHQANLSIIECVRRNLGIDATRVVITIGHTANTVAATLPIALDEATRADRLAPGDIVLFATVGAGYAGGAMLYRVPSGRR